MQNIFGNAKPTTVIKSKLVDKCRFKANPNVMFVSNTVVYRWWYTHQSNDVFSSPLKEVCKDTHTQFGDGRALCRMLMPFFLVP